MMTCASSSLFIAAADVVILSPSATAATIFAGLDSRSEATGYSPRLTHGVLSNPGIGPISSWRSIGEHLPPGLSGQKASTDVSLRLYNRSGERNPSSLLQESFPLAATARFVAAVPGTEGFEVATCSMTPTVGRTRNTPASTARQRLRCKAFSYGGRHAAIEHAVLQGERVCPLLFVSRVERREGLQPVLPGRRTPQT